MDSKKGKKGKGKGKPDTKRSKKSNKSGDASEVGSGGEEVKPVENPDEQRPKTPEEHKQKQVRLCCDIAYLLGRNILKIPRKHRNLHDLPDYLCGDPLKEDKGGKSLCLHSHEASRNWRRSSEDCKKFVYIKNVDALIQKKKSIKQVEAGDEDEGSEEEEEVEDSDGD